MTESTEQHNNTVKSKHGSPLDDLKNSLTIEDLSASSNSIPFQALSKHYPKLNAFSSFIGWGIILVIMLIVDLVIDKFTLHFLVLPALLVLSLLSGVIGYFSAKACGYFQDEFDIYFKQGLWWKKQIALNYSRIQHIDISHGPLERRYQMATIKFFTAGGAASDLRISGLPNEKAEQLRSDILRYAKEHVITESLADAEELAIQNTDSSKPEETRLNDADSNDINITDSKNSVSDNTQSDHAHSDHANSEKGLSQQSIINDSTDSKND